MTIEQSSKCDSGQETFEIFADQTGQAMQKALHEVYGSKVCEPHVTPKQKQAASDIEEYIVEAYNDHGQRTKFQQLLHITEPGNDGLSSAAIVVRQLGARDWAPVVAQMDFDFEKKNSDIRVVVDTRGNFVFGRPAQNGWDFGLTGRSR